MLQRPAIKAGEYAYRLVEQITEFNAAGQLSGSHQSQDNAHKSVNQSQASDEDE